MNIHHIIKTKSIESDGRLQKWIKSLSEHSINSAVFILEDENKLDDCFINQTHVVKTKLMSRFLFKKQKGYLFKIPEYALKFLIYFIK